MPIDTAPCIGVLITVISTIACWFTGYAISYRRRYGELTIMRHIRLLDIHIILFAFAVTVLLMTIFPSVTHCLAIAWIILSFVLGTAYVCAMLYLRKRVEFTGFERLQLLAAVVGYYSLCGLIIAVYV